MPDNLDFKEFLERKRSWYKKIGKVFCPVLNEWVIFNAKGFYHLRYDGTGTERLVAQQIHRLSTISCSIEIIGKANRVVEYRERVRSGVKISYWELSGMYKGRKITVIIKREGNGYFSFHSNW